MVFAILAWADCIFSLQGNSQDLFAGSGIRRHASFIINAQRGAGEWNKKNMNTYIQNYLKEKEEQEKDTLKREVNRVIQSLEIGEKVYNEKSTYTNAEFPKIDPEKRKPFKYDIGDATKEEYELLLKKAIKKKEVSKTKYEAPISKWHKYAMAMLIISIIGLLVLAILSLSEENVIYFVIGLGEFILFSLFCGIVQLLAGIKQGIDNLQNK